MAQYPSQLGRLAHEQQSKERPQCTEGQATLPRLAIGIASAGRAETLAATVAYLLSPAMPDIPIIVCVPAPDHAAGLSACDRVQLLTGPSGLTRQRNAILSACADKADLVLFFDDDFVPHPQFAAHMQQAFAADPAIAIATGRVIADGILGSAIGLAEAVSRLDTSEPQAASGTVRDIYNAYGCNMAVKLATARDHGIRFDESLPLYGWLEDVDFSRALARHGRCVEVPGALGVHLGVRSGRQPGRRLGYSQVANPWRMMRKGTLSPLRGFRQIGRNITANFIGTLFKTTEVDRRGRFLGNLMAMGDLLRRRLDPARILEIDLQPSARSPIPSPATQGSRP